MGLLFRVGTLLIALLTPCMAFADEAASNKLSGEHSRGVRIIQPDATPDKAQGAGGAITPTPAPVVPVAHSVLRPCERPFAKADVTLATAGSAASFDRSLSSALKSGRAVVVDLAEPYAQKDPPPGPLAPWLSAVKSGGGVVKVTPYCAGGRGIVRDWLMDIIARLTGGTYKVARNYDVTLYADATRRKVTQLEFRRRSGVSALASSAGSAN